MTQQKRLTKKEAQQALLKSLYDILQNLETYASECSDTTMSKRVENECRYMRSDLRKLGDTL